MDLWVDNIAFLKVPYPLNLLSSVPFIKPQGLLPSLILSKTTMHLHTSLLSSPFSSIHHFPTKILLPPPSTTTITVPSSRYRLKPPHSRFFLPPRHRHANPNFKFVRSSMGEEFRYMEVEEAELLLATCITRTLPPALTLEQGLDKIKDAVEELKSKPCHAKSGMYRFQIAVSPGSKALGLFCSQDPSSGLFPQFFVCTEVEKPTTEFLSFSRTRGVFGIGAAFYIKRPYYSSSVEQIPSKRHQSVDSANLMAYGLLDGDTISTSVKYETQSLYMFIPQIELVEYEGSSILDATLAWDDSSLRVFEEAVDAIIYLSTGQPLGSLSRRNTQTNASVRL